MRRVLFDFHNAAAATTYWPSASGVQAAPGLTEFHTQLDLVGSGGVTYTVEWTGDDSSSTGAQLTADAWKDVTSSCRNLVTGGTRFAASWVDSTCVLDISHITSGRWRVKRVTSDATNDGRGSIMTGAAAHNGLVDVASSALPDDAATETTLAAIEGDTSNMSPAYYPTRGATGPAGGVCLTLPIAGTSSYNAPLVHDMDTGAGTAYGLGVSIRKAGAGGSSALFVTATDRGFVGITDGTNNMPTMDAAARAGYMQVTDGTTTAKVTAASTAAVATDPGQVVSLSPNSPIRSHCGTWTPATAAAPADSAVISAAACKVGRVMAVNTHATITYYLMIFDLAAVPADATAPRYPAIPLTPGQAVVLDFGGTAHANGLCWSDSTTVATKTIAATTPFQVSAEIV